MDELIPDKEPNSERPIGSLRWALFGNNIIDHFVWIEKKLLEDSSFRCHCDLCKAFEVKKNEQETN